jgi:hypothetical protein
MHVHFVITDVANLEDYKEGGGANMLLLTIVLSLQLSHFVDTNVSLPLVSNHVQAQCKEKEQRT